MELNDIISLIVNHGLSAVVVGYFLIKDYKHTDQIIKLMGEIRTVLGMLAGRMPDA